MGIHRGPNTVKDGLVFGYDTGYGVADNSTATRFYPGEATENLANTESLRTMANYGGGTTTYAEAPEKGPGWKKVTITAINGSNHRLAKFPYISHPTNTTRTYSLELDFNGTSGYYVRGDGFTGLSPNVSTSGVHSWTLATTTNSGVFALFLNNGRAAVTGLNDVIYYRYYQVEAKGHATPFTATTRSSTASLIDLKKTTDIDASSMSFDSTGQPTFDGTDDTLLLGSSSAFNITSKMSVFAWIKPDSISGWKGIFGGAISGFVHFQLYNGGISAYVYGPAASYGNPDSASIGTNVWTNVGFTFGNNTLKVYLNGEQLPTTVTGNGGNISSNSDVRVGWAYATSRLFDGHINALTVHNKALTDTEVKQNYNAYKNRFDI